MSRSHRSSRASAHCRPVTLDWRPSPQVTAVLAALTLLAPFSLIASDLHSGVAAVLALPLLLAGVRTMRRYARLPPTTFQVPARGAVTRDDRPLAVFELRWRGPLVFLRWREPGGGYRQLAFFPDTLDTDLRRELKLAMARRQSAGATAAMAG